MDRKTPLFLLITGMFLAVGIAICGYFIGQTVYNGKTAINTAEAKGLAVRKVKANHGRWSLSFSVSSYKKEDVALLYKKAEALQDKISRILLSKGFSKQEITNDIIDYDLTENRDKSNKLISRVYTLSSGVNLSTHKVELIEPARKELNQLIAEGISIRNYDPRYTFTKLNDIKPQMLQEATKNARVAAAEFANNAGVEVGGIRSARQGSFYIRDDGEEYSDDRKIEKTVRVVTTISFYLTD